jgi:putative ABC transport system permease protein
MMKNPTKNGIQKGKYLRFQTHNKAENTYGNNISVPMAERAVKVIPEVKDFVLFNGSGMGRKMTTKNKTVYQGDGMSVSESFFNFFHLN